MIEEQVIYAKYDPVSRHYWAETWIYNNHFVTATFATKRAAVDALFDIMQPPERGEALLNLKLDRIIQLLNKVRHDD